MKIKKTVKEGVWCNFNMEKRKVRITIEENCAYKNRNRFAVWFETDTELFNINGGQYDSEYEATNSVEKIVGQNVQWSAAA